MKKRVKQKVNEKNWSEPVSKEVKKKVIIVLIRYANPKGSIGINSDENEVVTEWTSRPLSINLMGFEWNEKTTK